MDDCGGGYSESIAEMCEELQNGSLPLLILTPNGRDEAGTNRDCFILNPSASSSQNLKMFEFLGVLMAIAVRTGSPLSLNLAESVWKALVRSTFAIAAHLHLSKRLNFRFNLRVTLGDVTASISSLPRPSQRALQLGFLFESAAKVKGKNEAKLKFSKRKENWK